MFKSNMIWVNRYSKRFFCKPSYKEQINACCCRCGCNFPYISICYKEQINACCCRHGLVKMENILVIRNK